MKRMEKIPYKIYLEERDARAWYNIKADMKEQHDPFCTGSVSPV